MARLVTDAPRPRCRASPLLPLAVRMAALPSLFLFLFLFFFLPSSTAGQSRRGGLLETLCEVAAACGPSVIG